MSDVKALFQSLDTPFINYDSKRVEPISWQSKDLLVHRTYEISVPASAGSTIKYSFYTQIGDIKFSINLQKLDKEIIELVEPSRVPSDLETVRGTQKVDFDGNYIFVFDNTFSWFNPKILTYKINLYQVCHSCIIMLFII